LASDSQAERKNRERAILEMVYDVDRFDARFAYEEGERSLAYWRDAHWRFFSRTLLNVGREPTMEMPLVYERFRVIYR